MVTITRLNSRTMQMMISKSLEKNVFDAHAVNPSGVAVIVEKVRVLFM